MTLYCIISTYYGGVSIIIKQKLTSLSLKCSSVKFFFNFSCELPVFVFWENDNPSQNNQNVDFLHRQIKYSPSRNFDHFSAWSRSHINVLLVVLIIHLLSLLWLILFLQLAGQKVMPVAVILFLPRPEF